MAVETTASQLRANLDQLMERVADDRETVIVRRRGAKDVALISADELASLEETAFLLRSPRNAKRLMSALNRAKREVTKPTPVKRLRRELGLGRAK
jgi:antitoxin YefM